MRDKTRPESLPIGVDCVREGMYRAIEFHFRRELPGYLKVELTALLVSLANMHGLKHRQKKHKRCSPVREYLPKRDMIDRMTEAIRATWSDETEQTRRATVPGDYEPVI